MPICEKAEAKERKNAKNPKRIFGFPMLQLLCVFLYNTRIPTAIFGSQKYVPTNVKIQILVKIEPMNCNKEQD